MAKIKQIFAREILNAKGNPTIETTLLLDDGTMGIASCPSGTSVSSYEAFELHDNNTTRYNGLGVLKAIANIERIIAPAITGMEATKQKEIDKRMIELDGTENKTKLGANAMLCVSMSVAKAAANSSLLPLYLYLRTCFGQKRYKLTMPVPLFNIVNGGKHGSETLDFQEFLIIPFSSKSFSESLQIGATVYFSLKGILNVNGFGTLVGDEGGFGAKIENNTNALSLIMQAIETTQFRLEDVSLGLDVAANTFYKNQQYNIKDQRTSFTPHDLIGYYERLIREFHLVYLEDPMSENDWDGWREVVNKHSQTTLIVGDDIISTNPYRLRMAIDKKAITGVIIKPNQIGTVSEALAVVEIARSAGIKVIVSHRSGETNDDFIADFGVAVNADYVKFGAPARGERIAKYNRLLQIEEQMKKL